MWQSYHSVFKFQIYKSILCICGLPGLPEGPETAQVVAATRRADVSNLVVLANWCRHIGSVAAPSLERRISIIPFRTHFNTNRVRVRQGTPFPIRWPNCIFIQDRSRASVESTNHMRAYYDSHRRILISDSSECNSTLIGNLVLCATQPKVLARLWWLPQKTLLCKPCIHDAASPGIRPSCLGK